MLFDKISFKAKKNILFNFWSAVDELMMPELELWVLDQFNKGDKKAPRMRPVDNQPLQQYTGDLLLDGL